MTRIFDAPRHPVFEAWTKPEHVARWWGWRDSTLSVCEIDLRPGGAWRFVLRRPDGQEYPFKGVYREIAAPERLEKVLADWPAERLLVFCDEDAPQANPIAALASAAPSAGVALLIGPEGGFDDFEREAIGRAPNVLRLSLGPRILRADTAAVAALALVQSRYGDWR